MPIAPPRRMGERVSEAAQPPPRQERSQARLQHGAWQSAKHRDHRLPEPDERRRHHQQQQMLDHVDLQQKAGKGIDW